jgi:hypothetical protein
MDAGRMPGGCKREECERGGQRAGDLGRSIEEWWSGRGVGEVKAAFEGELEVVGR